MTYDEKRKLAVERELVELRKCVRAFDHVVADAQRLAAELSDGVTRLESIQAEDQASVCKVPGCNQTARPDMGVCTGCNESGALDDIDEKIDNLDRMMGRGRYSDLGSTLVDIARAGAAVVPFTSGRK